MFPLPTGTGLIFLYSQPTRRIGNELFLTSPPVPTNPTPLNSRPISSMRLPQLMVRLTDSCTAMVLFCSPVGHPVWNLRTKTPQNEQTTVPWHQDNAYLHSSALHTLQPAAWIPLIDTNMDAHWQHLDKPNGFHGLKECVPMRKADDPNYEIDWEGIIDFVVLLTRRVHGQSFGWAALEISTCLEPPIP